MQTDNIHNDSTSENQEEKMNLSELGARSDMTTMRKLIAYSAGRNKPASRATVYRMEKDGRIPKRIPSPLSFPVWDTAEVVKALGL